MLTVPNFVDLVLSLDDISVFTKNTNTSLYSYFGSDVPWAFQTAWIKLFTLPASCIYSPNKLSLEINFTKKGLKDFRHSSLACAKFDLMALNLVPTRNMMLIKLGVLQATPKIKQLFYKIYLLFMIFLVLAVVPITLPKPKEYYMKGQLNMLGLITSALFTNISTTTWVSNILCDIASL